VSLDRSGSVWRLDGLRIRVLAGSMKRKTENLFVRFLPKQEVNERELNFIHTHRHCGNSISFVIAGKQHIYELGDTLREIRTMGSCAVSAPSDVHSNVAGLRAPWRTTVYVAVKC